MKATEQYKQDLMKLYAELKTTVMTVDQNPAVGHKVPAKEALAAFNHVSDIMDEFIKIRKDYVTPLNDPEHDPDHYDYVYGYMGSHIEEYREAQSQYSDHKGRICRSDKCYLIETVSEPLYIIYKILNEAEFVGQIFYDLFDHELADSEKPHFLTEADKAEIERKEREREELERKEQEKQDEIDSALKSKDPAKMDEVFTKYGQKKFFMNPEIGEQDCYYKLGKTCYTKYGEFIGYSLIRKWNLVEEK